MKRFSTAIFLGLVFAVFLTPMELGDFWWHLATGQWIVEHGAIPVQDPFSITFTEGRDYSFVLSGFWLNQVLYAKLFGLAGLKGIILLKAAAFTAIFFFLLRTLVSYGLSAPLSCLLVIPAVFVAVHYDESRPQTMSFVFFAFFLMSLERQRGTARGENSASHGLLLPLMLLWANVHPGFVIGVALLTAYAVHAAAASLYERSWRAHRRLIVVGVLSIAISALNPNGLEALVRTQQMLLASIKGAAGIHEHFPMKQFTTVTREGYLYTAVLGLMALGILSFAARIKRPDVLHLVVFACLAFVSLKTFRGGLFFAVFATAVIGRNLASLSLPGAIGGKAAQAVLAAACVPVFLFLAAPRSILSKPLMAEGIFPDRAAGYILASKLPGNIYHPYEWGGYLIWRLYPHYKVYIDGRALGSITEQNMVLFAKPGWDDTLDARKVNTVLYWPLLPLSGNVPPLLFELLRSDAWSPVYWDTRSVIFVRSELARGPISKGAIWELLRSLLGASIASRPAEAAPRVALGEVYMNMGLLRKAKSEFRAALAIDPTNSKASSYMEAMGEPAP